VSWSCQVVKRRKWKCFNFFPSHSSRISYGIKIFSSPIHGLNIYVAHSLIVKLLCEYRAVENIYQVTRHEIKKIIRFFRESRNDYVKNKVVIEKGLRQVIMVLHKFSLDNQLKSWP
jgi:hypothetical protein